MLIPSDPYSVSPTCSITQLVLSRSLHSHDGVVGCIIIGWEQVEIINIFLFLLVGLFQHGIISFTSSAFSFLLFLGSFNRSWITLIYLIFWSIIDFFFFFRKFIFRLNQFIFLLNSLVINHLGGGFLNS